jgi:hypothetical protein
MNDGELRVWTDGEEKLVILLDLARAFPMNEQQDLAQAM